MRKLVWITVIAATLLSCGDVETTTAQKKEIKSLEKELLKLSEKPNALPDITAKRTVLVEKLLGFYREHPEDPYAAECLDKVHMSYSAMRDYVTAAHYADTLIEKYPDYPNRGLILESQANNYDMFIQPRNKERVKYYLELRLKEQPDMDPQLRSDIEFRLKNIDLSMEEIIAMELTELK